MTGSLGGAGRGPEAAPGWQGSVRESQVVSRYALWMSGLLLGGLVAGLLSGPAFGAAFKGPLGSPAAEPATATTSPSCPGADPVAGAMALSGATQYTEDPGAGDWSTWWVAPADISVSPPPALASETTLTELQELHAWQDNRTPSQVENASRVDAGGVAGTFWEEKMLETVLLQSSLPRKDPPRMALMMGLLETAVYDALVITWHYKYSVSNVRFRKHWTNCCSKSKYVVFVALAMASMTFDAVAAVAKSGSPLALFLVCSFVVGVWAKDHINTK